MIYATDLDRTIIFSNKFLEDCRDEVVCVEEFENKPISYMTVSSLNAFEKLKENPNLSIIPVTTRSVAQFKRVRPVQDCEFAVTSNGGTILHYGKVFIPWYNHINNVLLSYKKDFKKMKVILMNYTEYYEKNPKLVDNMFFFMKLKDNEEKNQELLDIFDALLDKSKWEFTLQGLKLYVIPKEISKENALSYLKKYLKADKLIVSGDGKLDIGFLKIGDIRIIPEGSEVLDYTPTESFVYKSVPEGLNGTVDLFKIIKNNL